MRGIGVQQSFSGYTVHSSQEYQIYYASTEPTYNAPSIKLPFLGKKKMDLQIPPKIIVAFIIHIMNGMTERKT